MNIFEQASRVRLRFNLTGTISTEQLWDVKEDELISYEEHLAEVVENYGKSTRRKAGRKTNEQVTNELRLAIVTSILDTRIQEREEESAAAEAKINNQKITDIIASKKDAALANMSVEELEKLLK